MIQKLESDQAVEAELKALRTLSFPELQDRDFEALVFSKISAAPVIPSISLVPVFSGIAIVLIAALGFLFYFKPLFKIQRSASQFQASTLNGIVLRSQGFQDAAIPTFVQQKERLETRSGQQLTFFIEGLGYFHLKEGSNLSIAKDNPSGRVSGVSNFIFSFDSGRLYASVTELRQGSSLMVRTSLGTARIVGTDFVLEFKKDQEMSVEVLKGEVALEGVAAASRPESVPSGFGALILGGVDGKISIRETSVEKQERLRAEFREIFEPLADEMDLKGAPPLHKSNFRILYRKEE